MSSWSLLIRAGHPDGLAALRSALVASSGRVSGDGGAAQRLGITAKQLWILGAAYPGVRALLSELGMRQAEAGRFAVRAREAARAKENGK